MEEVQVTVGYQSRIFEQEALERRLTGVLPEPIAEHFVVISGRRFPPKQVIGLVTGIDRAAS